MAKVSRVASLDIPSEATFEEKEWKLERFGWAVMALMIVAGALGLLGGEGLLNTIRLGSPDERVWVEYPRVVRSQAPFELKIYSAAEPSFIGATTVHINKSYADTFIVESASPTVLQHYITPSVISYDFATPQDGPASIILRVKPTTFGLKHATISVEGAGSQTFRQIILP
jgi:hypothetical protein